MATIDNLQRRGFYLANRCVLCSSNNESVEHIFLGCDFVSEIWSRLSSTLSIHAPRPMSIAGFIQGWKGLNCVSNYQSAMRVILQAVFWFIWKERNDRIFRDLCATPEVVLHKILFAVGDWLLVAGSFSVADCAAWKRLAFDNG
ncbi:hypothetical protein LINPERHAP1_LOCUS1949 [Linum perenne]